MICIIKMISSILNINKSILIYKASSHAPTHAPNEAGDIVELMNQIEK